MMYTLLNHKDNTLIHELLLDADVHPLRLSSTIDSFSDPLCFLSDTGLTYKLLADTGYSCVQDWLAHINEWLRKLETPSGSHPRTERVLYALYNRFKERLIVKLNNARKSVHAFPERGEILTFTSSISHCLMLEYTLERTAPRISHLAVIENPKSIYDVWATIPTLTSNRHGLLKRLLVSGHKIIYYRDTLVYVDRRSESRVFGPSIDTLLMSEALMSYVEVTAPPNKRCDVLEIGCGSGLATAVLLRSTIECRRALLIDIEPEAILCTYKNLKLNGLVQSSRDLSRLSLLLGSFEPAEMCQSFDIVICNPPYVPYAPTRSVSTSDGLRMRAIAGLELITDLLLNLTPILTTNGVAVIIVNGATIDSLLQVFEALREDGFELTFLLGEDGLEVQFDLDEINSDQVWLSWLMDKGWVYERANILFHSIQAIAVRRLVQ